MEPTAVQPPEDEDNDLVMEFGDEVGGSTSEPIEAELTPPPAPEGAPQGEAHQATAEAGQVEAANQQGSEGPSVGGIAKDIGKGLMAGAESAVIGARETVRAVGRDVLGLQDPALQGSLSPELPQPEGIAGKITADITQLVLGYAGAGAAFKTLGIGATGLKGAMAKSAVGTPVVADPNRERVSNLIAENEWLEPVFGLLAQDPTDSVLLSKAKAGLEDVLTTAVAHQVFTGLKFAAMKITGKGSPAQIAKAEEEAIAATKEAEAPVVQVPEVKVAAEAPPKPAEANVSSTNDSWELRTGNESSVTLTGKQATTLRDKMQSLVVKDAGNIDNVPKPENPGHAAGQPNQKYMEAPGSLLQTMKEIGELAAPHVKDTSHATRTMSQTTELAQTLALEPDVLAGQLRQLAISTKDADTIALGARMTALNQTSSTFNAARRAAIDPNPLSYGEFVERTLQQMQTQADLTSVLTNAGRTLRVAKETVTPFSADEMRTILGDKKKVEYLAKVLTAAEGDADKTARILDSVRMTWGQKLLGSHNEYWAGAGLLSRVTTLTTNASMTALNVLMEPAAMTTGAVLRRDWGQIREGLAIYNGMRSQIFDSLEVSRRVFMSGKAELSQAGTNEVKTPFISSLTYNMNPDAFMGKFVDLMGNIVRLSFRGLTATDEFFKQVSYRGKVSAAASREAADMVKAGTLHKDGVERYVNERLQNMLDSKGAATDEASLAYAEKSAFVQDLKVNTWFDAGSIGELTARIAGNPILRGTILPFVKTPVNVMRTTFEYTPIIGQMRRQFWSDMAEGGEKQAIALGKLTMGSGFYTGAMMLALEGRITGAPPSPGTAMPPGWTPYSVVFERPDGTKRYVSYQRLQPFGDILGLTTDFANITGMLDVDKRDGLANSMVLALAKLMEPESYSKIGMGTAVTAANSLINKNFLRSLIEPLSILGGYNAEAKAEKWLDNKLASYVPGAISQFNGDDTLREVRSAMDAILSRIPGYSKDLPAKRDYFGDPRPNRVGFPWTIINPAAIHDGKNDPVMSELARLSSSSGQVRFEPPKHLAEFNGQVIDLKEIKNSEGVTAYDRMNELLQTVKAPGESKPFKESLHDVINGPRYQLSKGDDVTLDGSPMYAGLRTTLIKEKEGRFRKAAFEQMIKEYRSELGLKGSVESILAQEAVHRKKAAAGIKDLLLPQ